MNEIASRYALALFSLSKDEDKILSNQEEMKQLQRVFKENPDFSVVLNSRFLSTEERIDIVDQTFKNVDSNIISLFKILVGNNRTDVIEDLFIEFNALCNEYRGIDEGIVYSVNPLDETQLKRLEEKISKLENRKLELRNIIDPSLIGGIKIQIHDHIYDGSIKNQLENLRKDLLKKEDR